MFDRKKCMEYTLYKSDKQIYKGLGELVNGEIIARGPNEYVWFVNPMVVFNGDRVSFAKTYVKKKQSSIKTPKINVSYQYGKLKKTSKCLVISQSSIKFISLMLCEFTQYHIPPILCKSAQYGCTTCTIFNL